MTDRERLIDIIRKAGFVHPIWSHDLAVRYIRQEDRPVATALALLEMETGDGKNVYGHDPVNTFGCYAKGGPVNESNYRCYKRHRGTRYMQGVGPTQLTWWEYQDRADARGGCWKPDVNMAVGFEHLGALIRSYGVWDGYRRYNGAGAAAEAYAARATDRRAAWIGRLKPPSRVKTAVRKAVAKVAHPKGWSQRTVNIQTHLRKIGFPLTVDGLIGPRTRAAIFDFQRGWAGDMRFEPDGICDQDTMNALEWSAANGGLTSKDGHFKYSEFKSKGDGWIKVHRALILGLEKYRDVAGACGIVSGYRDPAHNEAVGGAAGSQHLYGCAADVQPRLSYNRVRNMGVFSGIGYNRSSGLVVHVDVRHASGHNSTGGGTKSPTLWSYPL